MNHSLQAEGFGVRLRPVRLEDAAFIVWLRNLEHAKGKVGDSAADVASQEDWLKIYFKRAGDYYFIIETSGRVPVGAYGLYNLTDTTAESGRWVIRPEVPAAIPSAILAFDLAFKDLARKQLVVKTVSTNRSVLSLNRKFGLKETMVETGCQIIGGTTIDMVHFTLDPGDWAKSRERLAPLARLAGMQVQEWERNQNLPAVGKLV